VTSDGSYCCGANAKSGTASVPVRRVDPCVVVGGSGAAGVEPCTIRSAEWPPAGGCARLRMAARRGWW